ncbi:MAG: hypothetical protein U0745_04540 [Polyangia bacterium]
MALLKPSKPPLRRSTRDAKLDKKSDKKKDAKSGNEQAATATTSEGSRTKIPELLAELEEAAKQLDVRVTYEAMTGELGSGGLCKVKGQWRVIVDKRATPGDRLSILALALSRIPRDGLTLSPAADKLLSDVRPREVSMEDDGPATDAQAAMEGSAP